MRRILFVASLFVLLTPAVAATAAEASLDVDTAETPAIIWCIDHYEYGDTLGMAIGNCARYWTCRITGIC